MVEKVKLQVILHAFFFYVDLSIFFFFCKYECMWWVTATWPLWILIRDLPFPGAGASLVLRHVEEPECVVSGFFSVVCW